MKARIITAAVALLFASAASAQDAETDALRQSMFEAADKIMQTVAGEASRIEAMTGVQHAANMKFALDDEERQNWQYWPAVRVGLPLENMSADQRRMTHDLLNTTLTSNGYLKVVHIMQLEQILDMFDEIGLPRAVDHYRLAVFGTPSMTNAWAWRFEGHHVSLNVSVAPEGVTVTPSFFGSNPAEVVGGPLAGFRVHGALEDLARGLVSSLTGRVRTEAILSDEAPREIFASNINRDRSDWDAWREALQPEGVSVASLNEVQQHWVGLILEEVVGNYRNAISEPELAALDVASLRFVWMGSTERGKPHYFRFQGEDFVFEYDNTQNNGNHVHSVWRSKASDFGMGMLERHYQTSHVQ